MKSIHLSMPIADIFGAGTCGKYLLREFAKRCRVHYDGGPGKEGPVDDETKALAQKYLSPLIANVTHPLLQFPGPELEQVTSFRGQPNVGYIFSEWEPVTEKQRENLRAFDVLVAGSEWNANVIRAAGFDCAAVPQGVDREVFHPRSREKWTDKFVIYSGGKWEHRKAQDLVIKAVKVLQNRHDDVILVASWFNIWYDNDPYLVAAEQGLRIVPLPLIAPSGLNFLMNQTDVGVFPNRCEGGTNLMLMNYMACGRPVVASDTTGQRDVLGPEYAVMLDENDDADTVEEMIEGVEYIYQNATVRRRMGEAATSAMSAFPWSRTADGIEHAIRGQAECRAAA